MAGTSWPSLVAGQKARAADVELKFDWLEGDLVPMVGGSTTSGVYSLGTTTARFLAGYFGNGSSTSIDINAVDASIELQSPTGGHIDFKNSASADYDFRMVESGGNLIIHTAQTAPALNIDASGTVSLGAGVGVNEFSNDGTLAGNSDLAVPTEKAVKTYADTKAGAQGMKTLDKSGFDLTTTGYVTIFEINTQGTVWGFWFNIVGAGSPAGTIRVSIDGTVVGTAAVGATANWLANQGVLGGDLIAMSTALYTTTSNLDELQYPFKSSFLIEGIKTSGTITGTMTTKYQQG